MNRNSQRIPLDVVSANTERLYVCNIDQVISAFVKLRAPLYLHQSCPRNSILSILIIPSRHINDTVYNVSSRATDLYLVKEAKITKQRCVFIVHSRSRCILHRCTYTFPDVPHRSATYTRQTPGIDKNLHTAVHAQQRTRNENSLAFTRHLAQSTIFLESTPRTHLTRHVFQSVAITLAERSQ